jgi:hypothetical protein
MTRDVIILMRAISITRAIGRGGLEIETFSGLEMATSDSSAISVAMFLRSLDFPKSRLGPGLLKQ